MFAWRSPFGFVVESVNSNIPNQKAERLLFRLVAAMPRYGDVEGLEWIRLHKLGIHNGGKYSALDIKKATDLFAYFDDKGIAIHPSSRLVMATFEVKFSNARRSRSLTIYPANHALYTRDEDSTLLEKWMGKRGFLVGVEKDESDEEIAETMERSGYPVGFVIGDGGMAAAAWG
ncbi:MAG: hypothetical protein H7834_10925, partial [Magnetococcus sp. YQC-9]